MVIAAALLLWAATQWVLTGLLNADSLADRSWPHTLVHHFPLSHLCSFLLGVAGGYLVLALPRDSRLTGWSFYWDSCPGNRGCHSHTGQQVSAGIRWHDPPASGIQPVYRRLFFLFHTGDLNIG